MAIDPHDVTILLQRAQRALEGVAAARNKVALTLAETQRLLNDVPATAALALPSHKIVADVGADHVEPLDLERREYERLAAQLEAAKATARAIAHALNQPLAIIQGVTELIQTAPLGESSAPDLAQILAATDRAAAIVRDLIRVERYTTQLAADGNPMLDLSTAIDPPALLE